MSNRPAQPAPKWVPSSEPLAGEQFEDAIAGPMVMVHFWAPWNPYDKQLDANLMKLRAGYEKKFRFFSANADETAYGLVMEQHHVAALPAVVCFENGRAKGRFHGVETIEALKAFLEEMVKPTGR